MSLSTAFQFESGAILLYLGERCGQLSTPAARARAAAWVSMANTGLTNSLFVDKFREKGLPDVMGSLERVLQDQVRVNRVQRFVFTWKCASVKNVAERRSAASTCPSSPVNTDLKMCCLVQTGTTGTQSCVP